MRSGPTMSGQPAGVGAFVAALAHRNLNWGDGLSSYTLLKPRLFQYLGDRSYSIYLWHWPLIVFYGVLLDPALMATIGAALVIIGADARRW